MTVSNYKDILTRGPNGCPGYPSVINTAATETTAAMYGWVFSLELQEAV